MVSVAAAGGSSSWYSFSAAAAVAVTWAATAVAAAMAVATTAAAAATTAAAKKRTYPLGGEGTPLRPWRLSGVGEYQLHRHVVLGVGQLLLESVGGTHGHGEPGIALQPPVVVAAALAQAISRPVTHHIGHQHHVHVLLGDDGAHPVRDRKSTRLNS